MNRQSKHVISAVVCLCALVVSLQRSVADDAAVAEARAAAPQADRTVSLYESTLLANVRMLCSRGFVQAVVILRPKDAPGSERTRDVLIVRASVKDAAAQLQKAYPGYDVAWRETEAGRPLLVMTPAGDGPWRTLREPVSFRAREDALAVNDRPAGERVNIRSPYPSHEKCNALNELLAGLGAEAGIDTDVTTRHPMRNKLSRRAEVYLPCTDNMSDRTVSIGLARTTLLERLIAVCSQLEGASIIGGFAPANEHDEVDTTMHLAAGFFRDVSSMTDQQLLTELVSKRYPAVLQYESVSMWQEVYHRGPRMLELLDSGHVDGPGLSYVLAVVQRDALLRYSRESFEVAMQPDRWRQFPTNCVLALLDNIHRDGAVEAIDAIVAQCPDDARYNVLRIIELSHNDVPAEARARWLEAMPDERVRDATRHDRLLKGSNKQRNAPVDETMLRAVETFNPRLQRYRSEDFADEIARNRDAATVKRRQMMGVYSAIYPQDK